MTWVAAVASVAMASMALMVAWVASSGGVDGVDGVDGGGVDAGLVASMASNGGVRMVVTGVFDAEGTDVEVPLCPQLALCLHSLQDVQWFVLVSRWGQFAASLAGSFWVSYLCL